MALDVTGLKPLDTSGLDEVKSDFDTSGLTPLDTSGLTPVDQERSSPIVGGRFSGFPQDKKETRDEDSWATLGRRLLENAPDLFKMSGGGMAQRLAEQPPTPPAFMMPGDPQWEPVMQAHGEIINAAREAGTLPGQRMFDDAFKDLQANAPDVDPESLKGYAYDIAQSFVQMIPAVAATLVTRKPAVGASVIGTQVMGTQYGESRQAGRSVDQATADAVFYGVAEAIPEMIPLGILMKPGKSFLSRALKAGAAESIQEVFTEALQSGYDAGILDEEMTWGEALTNLKRAGIVGAGAGASLAVATDPFMRRGGDQPPPSDNVPPDLDPENIRPFDEYFGGAEPQGRRERARAQTEPLSPEDEASPIPNQLLLEGREFLADAVGEREASEILDAAGFPPINSRVMVGPEGRQVPAIVVDAFDEDGVRGAKLQYESGRIVSESFEALQGRVKPIAEVSGDAEEIREDAEQVQGAGRPGPEGQGRADLQQPAQARPAAGDQQETPGATQPAQEVALDVTGLAPVEEAPESPPAPGKRWTAAEARQEGEPFAWLDGDGPDNARGAIREVTTDDGQTRFEARSLDDSDIVVTRPTRIGAARELETRLADADAAPAEPTEAERKTAEQDEKRRQNIENALKSEPIREELRRMTGEMGWAERGGRIIRKSEDFNSPDYNEIVGRTPWLPNADWWAERPFPYNEQQTERIIDRGIRGESLGSRQAEYFDWLVEKAQERFDSVDMPTIDELREEGLDESQQEAETVALIARATEIDEDAIESLATRFEEEDAGFVQAVRDFLAENEATSPRRQEGADPQEGALDTEGLTLTASAAPPASDSSRIPPETTAQSDLFGDDTQSAQALADETRRRDEARQRGQESAETGDPGDLFSQARQQVDIDDQAQRRPATDEQVLPAGWTEASPGGMATSQDPETGGIVDKQIATGKWFAIPGRDGAEPIEGFGTRAEAIAALDGSPAADEVDAEIPDDLAEDTAVEVAVERALTATSGFEGRRDALREPMTDTEIRRFISNQLQSTGGFNFDAAGGAGVVDYKAGDLPSIRVRWGRGGEGYTLDRTLKGKPLVDFVRGHYNIPTESSATIEPSEGATDVRNRATDLERDSGDTAATAPVDEAVDGPRPGEAAGGTRPAGEGTGVRGGLAEGDARVRNGGAPASRERGDQSLRAEQGQLILEGQPAGTSDDGRSDSTGDPGVQADREGANQPAKALAANERKRKKREAQQKANRLTVVPTDSSNIVETLPYLFEGQHSDVKKAEDRFSKPDGYGMLFTNGTGTGKTFTGLGVVRRYVSQGKTNILIVAPSDKIISDWVDSAGELGIDVHQLADTQDAGQGVSATTYANLGQNSPLVTRDWDLIVTDEAHYLTQGKEGKSTDALRALRALTLHPEGDYRRAQMLNPETTQRLDELRRLEEEGYSLNEKERDERSDLVDVLKAEQEKARELIDANQGESRPRALFLSATPFAYEKTVDWANGYLFDYNAGRKPGDSLGYNVASGRDAFFTQHFGYRMRYNRLTEPDSKVDRGLMQRQFNTWLRKQGVLSNRTLDVDADYDRKFVLIESKIGNRIDVLLDWLRDTKGLEPEVAKAKNGLESVISGQFDHLSRRYFLEAIKAEASIEYVRQSLDLGRKVVVFHDFKKGGGFNPFIINKAFRVEGVSDGTLASVLRDYRQQFKDVIESGIERMRSPIEAYQAEFPDVLLYNGDVPKKQRRANAKTFNDDDVGAAVILAQSAAGKEGISLHDTTGKHQRVLLNLGLPTQPTTAIQQEGRIYRVGQVSDAMFRYFNTGTSWEKWAFATTIAQRASAAENLAQGEQARALKDAFIAAFQEADYYRPGMDGEGKGGKERDRASNEALSEFDRAKAFYWGTEKKSSQTKSREGKDYFATPEPLGLKMVEWADVRSGDKFLEPSAGHGAIARWAPSTAEATAIEPSGELSAKLAMVFDGTVKQQTFEDLNIVNKYDAIVMNPPFGHGGKTAIDHLDKAVKHLRDGGRVVALIPHGPAADKKFDKWYDGIEGVYTAAEIVLPTVTFERAATSVAARIMVLDKRSEAFGDVQPVRRELKNATKVDELFDRLEDMSIPGRPDRLAGSQPSAPGEAPEAVAPSGTYAPDETVHGKTGEPLYVAKVVNRMPREQFVTERQRAKAMGGWYSSFRGSGAIPGFQFKTPEDRDDFIAGSLNVSESATPYGDAPIFFSTLARAAENLPQARGAPDQMMAMLRKQPGVKLEEVRWTGIEEWLRAYEGKSVTRNEIVTFLSQNGVQVDEVVLGGPEIDEDYSPDFSWSDPELQDEVGVIRHGVVADAEQVSFTIIEDQDAGNVSVQVDDTGQWLDVSHFMPMGHQGLDDAELAMVAYLKRKAAEDISDAVDGPPKFSEHVLPGGENYREVLLTLPAKQTGFDPSKVEIRRHRPSTTQGSTSIWYDGKELVTYDDTPVMQPGGGFEQKPDYYWMDIARSLYEKGDKRNDVQQMSANFTGGHFDQPNVLAHVRLNDRIGPNGERVLFIEEVQSDWHQKGRREGYRKPGDEELYRQAVIRQDDAWPDALVALEQVGMLGFDRVGDAIQAIQTHPDWQERWDVPDHDARPIREYIEAVADRQAKRTIDGPPDAPFKNNAWVELVIKRVIRMAADEGYDTIAWTTGQQQADRYDLSKRLSHIKYKRNGDTFSLSAESIDGQPVFDRQAVAKGDLEGIVGKDIAAQIIDGAGEARTVQVEPGAYGDEDGYSVDDMVYPSRKEAERMAEGWTYLTGNNLRVGGEGMISFYDRTLPNLFKKVGKKLDKAVQPGQVSVPGMARRGPFKILAGDSVSAGRLPGPYAKPENAVDTWWIWDQGENNYTGPYDSEVAAQTALGGRMMEDKFDSTVHAIDITDAMREGAAQGLPLFSEARATYTDAQYERAVDTYLRESPDESQADAAGLESAKSAAIDALADLRSAPAVLGRRFSSQLAQNRRASLVGQKASSPGDFAALAQIYRDPRFETLRLVFIDADDKVIAQLGITSRLPAAAPGFMGKNPSAFTDSISLKAKEIGAAGFYMLHNHPTGDSRPSVPDERLTRLYAADIDGFRGHVVINHNEYSVINANGESKTFTRDFDGTTDFRPEGGIAGRKVTGPQDVMDLAANMKGIEENQIVLIHMNNRYVVQNVSMIHVSDTLKPEQQLKRRLAQAAFADGPVLVAVGRHRVPLQLLRPYIMDAIHIDEYDNVWSMRTEGNRFDDWGRSPITENRPARLSPDTSEVFDYLRDDQQSEAAAGGTGDGSGEFMVREPGRDDMSPDGFSNVSPSVVDLVRQKLQDRYIDLRRLQQEKPPSGDRADAYLAEELYHGKAEAAIEEAREAAMTPLMEAVKASGLTLDQADEYLYARHAKERNARIQEINLNFREDLASEGGGSGMTDSEADAILARYKGREDVAKIGEMADIITRRHRDLLVESGLERPETVETWEALYDHYVPLKGFETGDEAARPSPGRGRGFDVRGRTKRAFGRRSRAASVITNLLAQYETDIIRSQKAEVGRALLRFAQENPDPAIWEVDKVEYAPSIDPVTGFVQYRPSTRYQLADNVLVVKVGGVDHHITFHGDNGRRIAFAMKNLGAANAGPVIRAFAGVNRVLAMVNTSLNPEFVVSNLLRDLQTAGINLAGTQADALKGRIIRDVGSAWRGIRQMQKGKPKSEWATHFDDFRKAGGKTGWIDAHSDVNRLYEQLVKELKAFDRKPGDPRNLIKSLGKFIEAENVAVENAVRLSAFVHARRAGVSEKQAASLAKNLTVNFNRKGEWGVATNALYLFYNATVQGNVRMLQALRSPKVRAIAGGIVVFAAMLDILNRLIGGDDEDGTPKYDNIQPWIKERNLIIMAPGTEDGYVKVPLPWGYNIFHVMGQQVGEAASSSMGQKPDYKPLDSATKTLGAVFGAFNPLGSDSSIGQFLSPTVTDPIVSLGENRDWAGRPIRPEDNPFATAPSPDSQKYWNSTGEIPRWVTERINELTGGSAVRPGAVDVSPTTIEYLYEFMTGGAGRFLANTVDAPLKQIVDGEVEHYRIPFLRKVYGEVGSMATRERYYDNLEQVYYAEQEMKVALEEQDAKMRQRVRAQNRPFLEARIAAKESERELRALREIRDGIRAQPMAEKVRRRRLRQIEERMEKSMLRFNKRVQDLRKRYDQ